jgi:predicted ATP-dependent serine protease
MNDVRIDEAGELRCWNCGSKNFHAKRTGRAHVVGFVTVGVGALATKKKLKCQQCGEYNQVGDAKRYFGPENKKYRRQYEREKAAMKSSTQAARHVPAPEAPKTVSLADELTKLASLRDAGVLTDEEFNARKKKMLDS